MLINYFTIAVRNLLKNPLFSAINISGMAISLASFLLISLFVWDELSYDRHHPDRERTYRVYDITDNDGVETYLPIVPYPFASYMQKDFPEIESTLRIMDTYGEQQFVVGDKKILERNGIYAEPSVFDMLSIHLTSGGAEDLLQKPNTVALSSSLATKYFGDRSPVGENISISNSNYQITGIYEDVPSHMHITPSYILSFATIGWDTQFQNNWLRQQLFTYVKLRPGTDANVLEAKFKPFVEKYAYPTIEPQGFTYVPHLQNIADIYLHSSNFEWDIVHGGNAQMVYVLAGTAMLILVIACLNFINLSTARSIKRTKEVGIRKVAGARRNQLILQFITESICLTMVSLLFALLVTELAIPYLNTFTGKDIAIPFTPLFVTGVIAACVLLGVVAGSYPAFHLSGFRPAWALYNKSGSTRGTSLFRHALVSLQFVFSFLLIVGAMIVVQQQDLLMTKDLGFSKDQLVLIPLRKAHLRNTEATKQAFSNHPNIVSSTIAFGIPGDLSSGDGVIDPTTKQNLPTTLYTVDHDYITTMGMHIIAGRDFSNASPVDEREGFILNETAVKTFGFGSPEKAIGHDLEWKRWDNDSLKKGKVIGVVRDFHFKSLRDKLTPVVMHIYPDAYWKIVLKIKSTDVPASIAHLKQAYEKIDGEYAFSYKFVDDNFSAMYTSERKLSVLLSIFTAVAIAVACFGLFGLVEYSVNQRIREIGIRKVFGASVRSLVALLTRTYVGLVVISFVVMIPLSYYAADQWLSGFAYHINISPWLYGKSFIIVMAITFLTVSFQSWRAAWTNPVKTLRND